MDARAGLLLKNGMKNICRKNLKTVDLLQYSSRHNKFQENNSMDLKSIHLIFKVKIIKK
jgi:hypothetical protein